MPLRVVSKTQLCGVVVGSGQPWFVKSYYVKSDTKSMDSLALARNPILGSLPTTFQRVYIFPAEGGNVSKPLRSPHAEQSQDD